MASDNNTSWEILFAFQKRYRSDHKLTGTAFLRQLELPGTLLPYLYSECRQPSKKASSIGGKLRGAIEELRKDTHVNCEKNNSCDLVAEYFIIHKSDFSEHGVFAVNIGEEGELQIYTEKDIEKSTAVELFAKCTDIDNIADMLNRMTVSVFLPAAKFVPPVAIRSGLMDNSPIFGYGTLTPVLGEFGLFGITAKHCLLPPNSNPLGTDKNINVWGYPFLSNLTSRRMQNPYEKIGVFSRACLSSNDDIAVVMLSESNAYMVNEISPGITIRLDGNPKTEDIVLQKGNVMKVGISTLTTLGKICENIPGGNFVVRTIECCCFAAPGDSGSLVVSYNNDKDTEDGIVLGIISKVHNDGRAYCVPISALYDIDLIKDC